MFAGIYYGGMYGGSTTSILLNTPGETASIVTAIEGNKMAEGRTRRRGAGHRGDRLASSPARSPPLLLTLVAPAGGQARGHRSARPTTSR